MRVTGVWILLLLCGLLHFKANAKPYPKKPVKKLNISSLTQSADFNDFKTLTIPIKRAGNLIIVEAEVDSVAGNFVLDTGAPYLVLNATYFRDMPHIGDQESNGVNGGSAGTFRTRVSKFTLGFDLNLSKVTADVADLSPIENSKKIKILGLLGTGVFNKMAITVDLFHDVLYIHKLDPKGNIPDAERIFTKPELNTPFKFMNNVMFIQGTINDKKLWLAFDTGAESNLLSYNMPSKFLKNMQVINKSKLVGVGGATSYEIIYANFDRLIINNYVFLNNRVLITDLSHLGKAYGQSVDAILGYDFFSRGIFTINFTKKEFEMYIYKH